MYTQKYLQIKYIPVWQLDVYERNFISQEMEVLSLNNIR